MVLITIMTILGCLKIPLKIYFEEKNKLFISVIDSFQDEIEHMLADTGRKEQQMSEKTPPFEDLRTQHKDATEKYEGKNKLLVCKYVSKI